MFLSKIIHSPSFSYELIDVVGNGAYASVIKGIKLAPSNENNESFHKHFSSFTNHNKMGSNMTSNGTYSDKNGICEIKSNIVAIKVQLVNTFEDQKRIYNEIKIHRYLDGHPAFPKLYESWEDNNKIFIAMEYINGRTLLDYVNEIQKMPENEIKNIFSQIVSGVKHMHTNMIMHRDLKLENIMITPDKMIKIIDFGVATQSTRAFPSKPKSSPKPSSYSHSYLPPLKLPNQPSLFDCIDEEEDNDNNYHFDDNGKEEIIDVDEEQELQQQHHHQQQEEDISNKVMFTTICGSSFYTSPERLSCGEYSFPGDIWSLGVILFSLATCSLPYYVNEEEEAMIDALTKQKKEPSMNSDHNSASNMKSEISEAKEEEEERISFNVDREIRKIKLLAEKVNKIPVPLYMIEDMSSCYINLVNLMIEKNPNLRINIFEVANHPYLRNEVNLYESYLVNKSATIVETKHTHTLPQLPKLENNDESLFGLKFSQNVRGKLAFRRRSEGGRSSSKSILLKKTF